jgi:hypothetical protein
MGYMPFSRHCFLIVLFVVASVMLACTAVFPFKFPGVSLLCSLSIYHRRFSCFVGIVGGRRAYSEISSRARALVDIVEAPCNPLEHTPMTILGRQGTLAVSTVRLPRLHTMEASSHVYQPRLSLRDMTKVTLS